MNRLTVCLAFLISCASGNQQLISLLNPSAFNRPVSCPKDFDCEEVDLNGAKVLKFDNGKFRGQLVIVDGALRTISLFRPEHDSKSWENDIKSHLGGEWIREDRIITIGDATTLQRSSWNSVRKAQAIVGGNQEVEVFHVYRESGQ